MLLQQSEIVNRQVGADVPGGLALVGRGDNSRMDEPRQPADLHSQDEERTRTPIGEGPDLDTSLDERGLGGRITPANPLSPDAGLESAPDAPAVPVPDEADRRMPERARDEQ